MAGQLMGNRREGLAWKPLTPSSAGALLSVTPTRLVCRKADRQLWGSGAAVGRSRVTHTTMTQSQKAA
jgi:hypothetical protein